MTTNQETTKNIRTHKYNLCKYFILQWHYFNIWLILNKVFCLITINHRLKELQRYHHFPTKLLCRWENPWKSRVCSKKWKCCLYDLTLWLRWNKFHWFIQTILYIIKITDVSTQRTVCVTCKNNCALDQAIRAVNLWIPALWNNLLLKTIVNRVKLE